MIGIYKITNKTNGRCYIGQSTHIEKRWKDHYYAHQNVADEGYDYPLYKAMRKYGYDNFTFEVLEECDFAALNEREMFYIKHFNSFNDGYNQTLGGDSTIQSSKLTVEQVLEIQDKLLTQNYTLKSLSEEYGVHRDTIRDINNGWSWSYLRPELTYPLYYSKKHPSYSKQIETNPLMKKKKEKQKNYCPKCGKEISLKASHCQECAIVWKGNYPSNPEEIVKDITELGFMGAGRKYGVSDNSLRKHCKRLGLPTHSSDYKPKKVVNPPQSPISVQQFDLNNNFIQSFNSYSDAAKWVYENGFCKALNGGVRSHIGEAAKGTRKTAYGFIWKNE